MAAQLGRDRQRQGKLNPAIGILGHYPAGDRRKQSFGFALSALSLKAKNTRLLVTRDDLALATRFTLHRNYCYRFAM